MLNNRSSPLALLETRRSGKPRDLVAPGPDDGQLAEILAVATRTPDHGKLSPWRFVIVPADRRDAFAALLADAIRARDPSAHPQEFAVAEGFARQAPTLVVALFSPVDGKIPLWEQELSTGAACMNLLHAAHAQGFAGGWVTGWAAYDERVRDAFGAPHERIAGFLFLGTPGHELEERPRPHPERVVSVWR